MGLALFFLLLFFTSPPVAEAVAVSVVLFESMPLAMSDNLIVPLFAGMVLTVTGA
jgi:dolichol kinase